jgi:hypothetical protein
VKFSDAAITHNPPYLNAKGRIDADGALPFESWDVP